LCCVVLCCVVLCCVVLCCDGTILLLIADDEIDDILNNLNK